MVTTHHIPRQFWIDIFPKTPLVDLQFFDRAARFPYELCGHMAFGRLSGNAEYISSD
jgi:hypothetical protein